MQALDIIFIAIIISSILFKFVWMIVLSLIFTKQRKHNNKVDAFIKEQENKDNKENEKEL